MFFFSNVFLATYLDRKSICFFFLEENEIDLARFRQFQTLLFNLTYFCYSHWS